MFDLTTIQMRNVNAIERFKNPNKNVQLHHTLRHVNEIAEQNGVRPIIALQSLSQTTGRVV